MPKRKKCPVCSEEFLNRRFYHHYDTYFDKNTNSWLDHGSEADKTTARLELEETFKNPQAGIAIARDIGN